MKRNKKWIFLISFVLIFSLAITGVWKKRATPNTSKDEEKVVSEVEEKKELVEKGNGKKEDEKREDEEENKDEDLEKEEEKTEDKTTEKKEVAKPEMKESTSTENKENKTQNLKSKQKKKSKSNTQPTPKKEEKKDALVTISIKGPNDVGIILKSTEVDIKEGDTVLDVLQNTARQKGIHLDVKGRKGSAYIRGIANIYEFDRGSESGWIYRVNGVVEGISAGACKVKNGDNIEWLYTTQLGREFK